MGNNKAPGEDGITSDVFKRVVNILLGYITAIYNGCLRSGTFPTRWKKVQILPITKPGKVRSEEVSKFRPISLLHVGGKVLQIVLINRINHHVFMNKNQYGFTPQQDTIDAAMEIKEIVEKGLAAEEVIALVSLDVKGAFEAAWWPRILKELRACGCPKNLYELTTSYFTQRKRLLQLTA
jgi:hypothetical protein